MKLETFFEKFDQFADAPNAVAKMRELVRHLAVTGKLVAQYRSDKHADELIARIAEQRRAKKAKEYQVVTADDAPYELPFSWSWVRLGNISLTSDSGWSPQCLPESRTGTEWGVLKVSAVSWGVFKPEENKALPPGMTSRPDCEVKAGDFLLSRANTEDLVARSVVVDQTPPRLMMSDKIVRFTFPDEIERAFINLANSSVHSRAYYARNASGTSSSMKNIGREVMCNLPIPLPPLAEQKRIVAKVDELMALCDRLEAQQQERETRHAALARASLARFADAPTPANLPFLFHPSYAIPPADLRKSILTLAVQGKLVPQDPNDEPAASLISQIAEEKRRLVAARIIRDKDEAAPITDDELPFEVPYGWEWTRLSSITRRIHYGYTASAKSELKDVRLLRITDIQNNFVDWPSVPGCEIAKHDVAQYQLERSDILVARTGGTVGKTYLVQEVPVVAVFASYLIRIQGGTALLDRYLKLFLESPTYWVQLEEGARGAAQPNVNGQTLGRMVVSVPPLAEQRRIVAKVEQLMALVDAVETQLAASRATAANLLSALVAELTTT